VSAARITILLAAACVALASVPTAPAVGPKRVGAARYQLTIATVPRIAGIRFQSAGQVFTTDRNGIARVGLPAGAHELRLVDAAVERNGVRSRFSRWGDDSFVPTRKLDVRGPVRLEVGFEQSVQVEFDFVDRADQPVDTSRVTTMTLTSTIGSRESFRPGKPRWLIAGRVARRFHGLEQTRIQYAVQRAVFDGSNVVHKAQQRFYPVANRRVVLHLLLFSARLGAHDLLFGFGVGKKLDLVYPDGRTVSFPMHGRQIVLGSLPRGTYGIKIHASGYSPAVPLALSKDQVIDLRVISYLDMFVIAFAVVALTAFLVLIRRPHLRRRLLLLVRRPNLRPRLADAWRRARAGPVRLRIARAGGTSSVEPTLATRDHAAAPTEAPEAIPEEPSRPAWSLASAGYRPLRPMVAVDVRTGANGSESASLELCANGHELTVENLYVRPRSGRSECRVCRRARRAKNRNRNV
jgi:hypothetical protein